MSRIDGVVICITNEGIFEKGKLDEKSWYTIDRVTLKTSDGKRLTRYAVCVNGRWNSNQQMTLREARAEVERLKQEDREFKDPLSGIKIKRNKLTEYYIAENGDRVSITIAPDDKATLIMCRPVNNEQYFNETYNTRRSALIAMHRKCGECKFSFMTSTYCPI